MIKRIQIDLHESIIDTLRAQAIREGRKAKPYIEHIITEKAKELDRLYSTSEDEQGEGLPSLTTEDIKALKAFLSSLRSAQ